jgi:hypothetical protein
MITELIFYRRQKDMLDFILKFCLVTVFFGATPLRAEVVQLTAEPEITQSSPDREIRVFGQIKTSAQWQSSEVNEFINIDTSPQYTALTGGYVEGSHRPLSRSEVIDVLGPEVGGEFFHFYSNKSDDYWERQEARNFAPLSASVFEFKMVAASELTPEEMRFRLQDGLEVLRTVDPDHSHSEITSDFATRVLEQVHSGHRVLQNLRGDESLILSSVRVGEYGCEVMTRAIGLLLRLTSESLPVYEGRKLANIYTMSVYREVTASELNDLEQVLGRRPKYAFTQEVFYAPQVLKDAHQLWAVFHNSEGGSQLVSYSVIATSTKATSQALSMALDGVSAVTVYEMAEAEVGQRASAVAEGARDAAGTALETADDVLGAIGLGFGDDEANAEPAQEPEVASESRFPMTISRDRVDLSREHGASACYKGLAKGLPWYAIDMFKQMIEY